MLIIFTFWLSGKWGSERQCKLSYPTITHCSEEQNIVNTLCRGKLVHAFHPSPSMRASNLHVEKSQGWMFFHWQGAFKFLGNILGKLTSAPSPPKSFLSLFFARGIFFFFASPPSLVPFLSLHPDVNCSSHRGDCSSLFHYPRDN